MRRTLGSLAALPLLVVLLVGCGSDEETARDPADSPGSSHPTSSTEELDYDATLVHATGAGGRVQQTLTPVGTAKQTDAFVEDFRIPDFATMVEQRIKRAGTGDAEVYAAVVEVGCDVPPGVDVARDGDQLAVTAREVASPLPECYAPVTTVAVVSLGA